MTTKGTRPYFRGVTECLGCGRLLRAASAKASKYKEETVERYGGGKCWPCYRDNKTHVRETPLTRPTDEQNREALMAWVRSRGGDVEALGLPPIEREAS